MPLRAPIVTVALPASTTVSNSAGTLTLLAAERIDFATTVNATSNFTDHKALWELSAVPTLLSNDCSLRSSRHKVVDKTMRTRCR